jgi:hypothetical protein
MFRGLERLHLHVLPRHFYSPVADRRWLEQNPDLWRLPQRLRGIGWDLDRQLVWLEQTCTRHLDEVRGFSYLGPLAARGIAFRYGPIEGQVLHCAVRSLAPPLVVEVGSGASTALIADAAARNAAEGSSHSRIVTIDPFAPDEVLDLPGVEVIRQPAQSVAESVFRELGDGDLLFIDSTHVIKAGSELGRLYLDVLPGLPGGVTIQIHDIYLPYLYSPWILTELWDWQETLLLAALLVNNPKLEVLCALAALHDARPDYLRTVLPDYRPLQLIEGIDAGCGPGHYPSSIWLRSR